MSHEKNIVQSTRQANAEPSTGESETATTRSPTDQSVTRLTHRDPAISLAGCNRIVIVGRTGSGKTTLARDLATALNMPHVELDALYFGPEFSTAPLSVLRERTSAAIAGDRWVTDGNKSAVRDLVWPRADTIIWLDYSVIVSLWRLGRRALWRASVIRSQTVAPGRKVGIPRQFFLAAKGVLTALRSHMGQRREYPKMFAEPQNQHLAVLRLQSPRATRRWLARVVQNELLRHTPDGTEGPSANVE